MVLHGGVTEADFILAGLCPHCNLCNLCGLHAVCMYFMAGKVFHCLKLFKKQRGKKNKEILKRKRKESGT